MSFLDEIFKEADQIVNNMSEEELKQYAFDKLVDDIVTKKLYNKSQIRDILNKKDEEKAMQEYAEYCDQVNAEKDMLDP